MTSIKGLLFELASIPDALGQDISDPKRQPWTSGEPPAAESAGESPTIDSGRWEITNQARWTEVKERTRQSVEGRGTASEAGIEALAWYVSFHHNQKDWGIYVPKSSLALMDELYLAALRMDRDRRLGLAWFLLLKHEQMHFAIDYACTQFELLLRAPIRREFADRFHAAFPVAGMSISHPYLTIEETAANAHMLRQAACVASKRTMLTIEKFVAAQPLGYREGLSATTDAAFEESLAETLRSYLAAWALEHRLDLGSPELSLERLLPLADQRTLVECPVYAIDDLSQVGVSSQSVRFISCISDIVETEKFAKQLKRLSDQIRSAWHRKKEQFKTTVPQGADFKKFEGLWSLRVTGGYRAHLKEPDATTKIWRAIAIGNHKEMGHG
jgi:hypothetical protein